MEEKPYFWMIRFTPQNQWIEGKGFLFLLAFFFVEIGAGIYIVSLLIGFQLGNLAGWLICAFLGGGLHFAYLGKPERAWRAMLRPQMSEISRGTILLTIFLILGAFQLAPSFLSKLPWASHSLFFKIIMPLLGFFVITHGFMTLSVVSALPFWNSGVLPVLSVASGVWLGTQIAIGISLAANQNGVFVILEPVARWSLFLYIIISLFYLWSAKHGSLAAQESLKLLTKGHLALIFYVGVILIAFLVPASITSLVYGSSTETMRELLYLRVGCAFVGDLAFRYCILKAARYFPLIESNASSGA